MKEGQMRLKRALSLCLLIAALSVSFCISISFADTYERDEIRKAIIHKKSRWVAKDTSVSRLTPEKRRKLLTSEIPGLTGYEKFMAAPSVTLPNKLDWRNYNGSNYVTPVKEQGSCGACWAFSTAAALESNVLISQNTPGINLNLSEQTLASCSGAGTCYGGFIDVASDFIRDIGLPLEGCCPYTATDSFCSNICPDWPATNSYKISDWYKVDATTESIKYALYYYGPVVALMAAQTDFLYYSSGVYTHAWGSFEGYHAALIVGYDDAEKYFIVKSSWGSDWGEAGYSKIAYSEINSEVKFGCWLIAYENTIPAGFPTIDGIPRNAPNVSNQDKDKNEAALSSVLKGTVKDGSGNAVSGANITVGDYSATTNDTGHYRLHSIPPENYVITATKNGYSTITENITIEQETRVTKDFVLSQTSSDGMSSKSDDSTDDQKKDKKNVSNNQRYLGPGWFLDIRGNNVSHEEAEKHFAEKRKSLASTKSRWVPMASVAEIPSEIQELARGLRHDPKLIYDYVHNHIDYVPYFGALKGAVLTYLDGSGNDFDQATLMIFLLRASGYTAQYVYGTMTIPGSMLANWFGVDQTWQATQHVIGTGQIPFSYSNYNSGAQMTRVWVKATINGADYLFDPALKSYTYTSKIDIGQAMGYNRSDLLTAATSGATITNNYAQNFNETNLRNILTTYASNLVNTFRNQYPNANVSDIIGGRKIVQTNLTQYQTTLPLSTSVTATWDDIPAEYTATLRIQVSNTSDGQSPDVDTPFNIPDLGDKSLSLTFSNLSGNQRRPELRLDGNVIYTGNLRNQGSSCYLVISVDHPFVVDGDNTICDQKVPQLLSVGPNTYAIITNYGGISEKLLQKRYDQLIKFKHQGLADDTPQVRSEILNIMGVITYKQQNVVEQITSSMMDLIAIFHHRFLVMAQTSHYYMDAGGGAGGAIFKHFAGQYTSENNIRIRAAILMGSGWEHGALEQTMGSDNPAMSTIKLLQVANSLGKKVFYANQANFTTGIRPQLINYTTGDLQYIQTKIDGGSTFYLPEDGAVPFGQKTFIGYIILDHGGIGMILGGRYGGSSTCDNCSVEHETIVSNSEPEEEEEETKAEATSKSEEPVNMLTGAYLYDRADLNLGGSAPRGLSFARSYDSSNNLGIRTLGYGWSHNNDIYMSITSHGAPGLGARSPVDAAAFLAIQYINLDLFSNSDAIDTWLVASLAAKWSVDQLIDNSYTVNMNNKKLEFVKLADSSYSPPPGVTTQLIKNTDGTFSLVERFGTRTNFNTDNQIFQISDIDGNTMTFTYNSDKTLASVHDAFNRTIALSYTGEKITTVSDSANRSVSYGYDSNDNLTSYTDPEGKVWSYTYDTNHRMTSLKNPLNITTATNTYDTLGRVMTQTTPRQGGTNATYNFYFSGYRNQEEDPDGHTITYYYDEKMREYAQKNPLGYKTSKVFDGQDHVITVTDPKLNSTHYLYDGNHNLTSVTNALGYSSNNAYDSQFRLNDTTDPLNHTTHFTYDTKHHLLSMQDAVGNTVSSTYYANGLKNTATDGRNTVTTLTYDSYGNPSTSITGSHAAINYFYDSIGRMTGLTDQVGSSTSFVFDKRGLLQSKTDSLGQTSTFTYDNAGKLTSKTDRKGNTNTYAYTPTNKLDTLTYPDTSTAHFTYNQLDNLTQMQDSTGTTAYTYDAANRLTSVTDPHGFAISYQYDEAGNLTGLTYPGNKKVIYAYDALNRLDTVTIDWLNLTASYTYDAAGRLIGMTNFNETETTFSYDNANRLTSLENRDSGSAIVSSYQFSLDGNGNRMQSSQSEPYQTILTAENVSYTYNTHKNRLLSAGANTFGYDNEGQLASGYSNSYTFDYEHRLTAIGSTQLFSYNGIGHRLQAVRNGVTTYYIYDAAGNLLAEADGNDNITRYYIYGNGLLAMMTPQDQTYCYHYNATGSTIALTDMGQNIVNAYAYDPFGNILNQQEAIAQPFKFVGQFGVMTEPNGFYYMRARYYDPTIGRFISEDPIGFSGGDVNLMAYVGNNPVMRIDPSGLLWWGDHFIATYRGARDAGKSVWDSIKLGWKVANVDIGTQDQPYLHAMVKKGEDPEVAIRATLEIINNPRESDERRLHAVQDLNTIAHYGKEDPKGFLDNAAHVIRELFESTANAQAATTAVLNGKTITGPKP